MRVRIRIASKNFTAALARHFNDHATVHTGKVRSKCHNAFGCSVLGPR
jgi:hypothetical protein